MTSYCDGYTYVCLYVNDVLTLHCEVGFGVVGEDVQRWRQDPSPHFLASVGRQHLLLYKSMLIRMMVTINMIYYLCWRNNRDLVVLESLPLSPCSDQGIKGLL